MSNPLMDTLDKAIEANEKLSTENNRLTIALQEIREYEDCCATELSESFGNVMNLAREALSNDVKIEHEGHLFTFGESTIEVEYLGEIFPFERVGDNDE